MNFEFLLWAAGVLLVAPRLYDAVYKRIRVFQADGIQIEKLRAESARHIANDEHGRAGVMVFGRGANGDPVVRNLDAGYAVTSTETIIMNELAAKLDAQHKALLALAAGSAAPTRKAVEELLEPVQAELPEFIGADRVKHRTHSIENLLIGYRIGQNNHLEPVESSIHDLMHVLEVGASGWGKSSWLRLLIYQLAKAPEQISIVAIDPSGSEFNPLKGWSRLTWPVARSVEDAASQLAQVSTEIATRRDLYAQTTATSLSEYNQYAGTVGAKELEPWLLLIDEGTHLLNQDGCNGPLREVVQTARQYGIWCVLSGQSANHKVISTQARDQFSTRMCFRVPPNSSRVVLGTSEAANLNAKGRAYVIRPGEQMCQVQVPFIERKEFVKAIQDHRGKPRNPQPATTVDLSSSVPTDEQIKNSYKKLGSMRQVELDLFGYTGGRAHERVRAVVKGD